MIELQRYIVQQLKHIHPRVYLEWAPQGAIFPYVVYNLPTSEEAIYREDFVLEIDIWDQPADGSTVVLQKLADKIDCELHRFSYLDSSGWFTRFFRINRLMIPDPDVTIRRRQLRYECKTYMTGGR